MKKGTDANAWVPCGRERGMCERGEPVERSNGIKPGSPRLGEPGLDLKRNGTHKNNSLDCSSG